MWKSANGRMKSKQSPIAIRYWRAEHASLPHIVKFSGGRSSAALAFKLAEAGLLNPSRGDVILFANTSAEHPGTYKFTAECKRRLECEFGLPFFWFEFCTVESASRGTYIRKLSFRLVKPVPIEKDINGYRSRGEVFEELLSFQGMLPNPHSRSCTAKLKLYPSHLLLAEWLGGTKGPSHAGHHADAVYVTPERAAERYKQNRGKASESAYMRRVQYMTMQPPARESQCWADFSDADIVKPVWRAYPRAAAMWGREAAQFVTLLGLRADEGKRVSRVLSRSLLAEGAGGSKCSIRTQPPGEHPYFPLHDSGYTKEHVLEYWQAQDFDLEIPTHAGNCVFCFMKGTEQLKHAARKYDAKRVAQTPSDIEWWVDVEKRYRREMPSSRGNGTSRFGFLGVAGPSFAQIASGNAAKRSRYASGTPACDCTD